MLHESQNTTKHNHVAQKSKPLYTHGLSCFVENLLTSSFNYIMMFSRYIIKLNNIFLFVYLCQYKLKIKQVLLSLLANIYITQ